MLLSPERLHTLTPRRGTKGSEQWALGWKVNEAGPSATSSPGATEMWASEHKLRQTVTWLPHKAHSEVSFSLGLECS